MHDVESARGKIGDALESALSGEASFIEAARSVTSLLEAAGFDPLTEPFVTLVAVDSETDDIPLGEVRELWQGDAVAKQTPQWDRAEAWAKQTAERAFRQALSLVRPA